MKRGLKLGAGALLLLAGAIFLVNYQATAEPGGRTLLLAHRGISQTFPPDGVTAETCTARIIHPPTHPFLENTIASMAEAFRVGADRVELDIHPTTDGQFAIFHDYTIECRTEGQGATRDHSMAYLKTLDIGYGYTADGGKTWPFRGKGVGLMPTLDEVLAAFPDKRFLLNIKSNEAREGELLSDRLLRLTPVQRSRLMVYGSGRNPMTVVRRRVPDVPAMNPDIPKACMLPYLALGWSGHVPAGCRNTIVPVPINYAWLAWGWPYRFESRMRAVNSRIWLVGPFHGSRHLAGVDSAADFARVPRNFNGDVLTNEIARIAPLARR